MKDQYRAQVSLLVRTIPHIAWKCRILETLRTANPAKFAEQTDLLREVLEYS